jgi:hypothetical protein
MVSVHNKSVNGPIRARLQAARHGARFRALTLPLAEGQDWVCEHAVGGRWPSLPGKECRHEYARGRLPGRYLRLGERRLRTSGIEGLV